MAQRNALTELVQEQVGAGRQYSVRAFAERAIDPQTGYSPGKSLVGKIVQGLSYTVTPELVRALAAGLDLPEARAQAAAALQFIGVVISEFPAEGATVRVAHDAGARPQDAPLAQAFIDSALGKSHSSDD
jgi:hypothetical protein